jgi:hypothetical protein
VFKQLNEPWQAEMRGKIAAAAALA